MGQRVVGPDGSTPVQPDPGAMVPFDVLSNEQRALQEMGLTGGRVITTYKPASKDDQLRMWDIINGDTIPIKDVLNTELLVVGWVIRPSDGRPDENGEINIYPITVLICADGSGIRAGSRGIGGCVMQLSSILGPCPWDPPLRVMPKARPVGEGRQWYFLQRVTESAADTKAKPKGK